MSKITFFIGAHVKPNVILDVSNIGWMLRNEFELDLVAQSCSDVDDNFEYFDKYTFDGNSKVAELQGLYNYLNNNKTDLIVQVTEPTQHGWLVALLSIYNGCKFIYRYDTDAFYSYKPKYGFKKAEYFGLHNIFGRWPPKLADGCIVLGPIGKTRLKDRGVNEDRIGVLPPSINPKRVKSSGVSASTALDSIDQENIVLFIGRLNRTKGFDFLLETIPEILKKRNDIHFLILGSGEQPDLDKSIEEYVTFTGFVQPSAIGTYLDHGDVLVLPSLREGLPRVILEALCSDITVIARDVGEIASVTNNTFSKKSDFIDMICSFEEYPQESAENYYRSNLRDKHIEFFKTVLTMPSRF